MEGWPQSTISVDYLSGGEWGGRAVVVGLHKYMYGSLCPIPFQVEDAATEFGAGLVQVGIETGQESFVGVYSRNCVDVCLNPSSVTVFVYVYFAPCSGW